MDRLRRILEARLTERIVVAVIVVNAISLGLETSAWMREHFGPVLEFIDYAALIFFVIELAARIAVYRLSFFKSAWNVFDFVVVAIALVPTTEGLSVLRALRVLRVLRLITSVPSLRRVVGALLAALPGMGSIVVLMSLVYYVFSVMAVKLFGADFPAWFGNIPKAAYTLFQVMTLESWSMGIVRPVMEKHPYAWLFFVPFILCTTFTVLNLFIGIVVSAMQSEHEAEVKEERELLEAERAKFAEESEAARLAAHEDMESLGDSVKNLRREIRELRAELQQLRPAQ
ncbi:MAG: ion transporter [Beijerinckiaceae bacterium]